MARSPSFGNVFFHLGCARSKREEFSLKMSYFHLQ